jgi:hypothetical protein
MFGKKGKSDSAKQQTLKVFGLTRSFGKENHSVSSTTAAPTVAPYELVNSLKQYSLEVELKKTEALAHWPELNLV